MFDNETVSVIIPVYNAAKYIGMTIESALNQTYPNIEIIIVDDCSEDNSRQLIEQYTTIYKNVRYHLQQKNGGAAVARNTALKIAEGRYVAFLDSDDLWYQQKVAAQLELMKQKNAAICFAAIEMIDEDGNMLKGKRNVREMIDYKLLLKNTMIATSTVIVDRRAAGDFQMPLIRSGQDYGTWLQLMRDGTNAYGINEVLVKYRKSRNSLSANKFKGIKQVWKIQTKNEKINPLNATYNVIHYAFNALIKHYF